MKPHISLITLGVDDLERALRFYRDGLGLKSDGIVGTEFEYGAVAFFDLQAGLRLGLWPRTSIARDTGVARSQQSPTEFILGRQCVVAGRGGRGHGPPPAAVGGPRGRPSSARSTRPGRHSSIRR